MTAQQSTPPPAPAPPKKSKRLTRAQRYASECNPLPAAEGETLEERVDRLDRSIDYLAKCYQDELDVRAESTLLADIFSQVLLPFAAFSAAASLLYVELVQWSSGRYPAFERNAAYGYLVLLALTLFAVVSAHSTGRPRLVKRMVDKTDDYVSSSVPERKETLTRNNYVNHWIYAWMVGGLLVFVPITFIVLRSGIGNDLGVRLAIDTANVCDGPGRIKIFTGSQTCVEIQEDHAPELSDTALMNDIGDGVSDPVLSAVEVAATASDARVAEIRLDTTTTLALAVIVLIIGIPISMGLWWFRSRRVRDIDVLASW